MRMLLEVSIPSMREDRYEREIDIVIHIEGEVWPHLDEYGVEILSARDNRNGAWVTKPSHLNYGEDFRAHHALIEAFEEAALVDLKKANRAEPLPFVPDIP